MSAVARGIRQAWAELRVVRGEGFTLLELAVCLAVLMTLSGVLLSRLHYYQEAAERADMEYM
jgi:type II secretory pathway pseudopilin PulG